jgi:hypothetical protein
MRQQAQHLAQLPIGGPATAELGGDPRGEDALASKLGVVLVDETIVPVVSGGPGSEPGPQLTNDFDPIRPGRSGDGHGMPPFRR